MENQADTSFSSKADYFRGGLFTVTLSGFEKANRVFIPGHRFLPFLNPAVRPWKVQLTAQATGRNLLRRIISEKPDAYKSLYSLFGEENFLFMLIDDRSENSVKILNSVDNIYKLNITAYDISSILPAETPLKTKLLFRIEDWEKGHYTVFSRISAEGGEKNIEAGEWIERLEAGFKTVFDKNRKLQMIPEVIGEAFIYGGRVLLENPVLSLEEFFEISEINNIADLISEQKEDPAIEEKKRYVREKTLTLIKIFTSWLENPKSDSSGRIDSKKILEKQVLTTKRTLIAVLDELNNPFISDDMIKTMLKVIDESEQLISRIR